MRSLVPPGARGATSSALVARGLPPAIARRVAHNQALALVAIRAADIARMHPADLTTLSVSGLDLVELRAVFAALPEAFANDADGKKNKWREALQAKLKEFTDKEAAGSLRPAQLRHPCYAELASSGGVGPFDPDAELPSMQAPLPSLLANSKTLP